MKITINGKEKSIEEKFNTLSNILSLFGKDGDYFAVAINNNFIPKHQYENQKIKEGDVIEIVTPHPGG
ncbi:MAG: thiamine biosynthesis protein ThiS [Halobacteriovoraceae bacterium]|nr:thiamine biosynthesis protein ThiS [Halobacteriovoraceae bacterium]|tara:strand:+ start:868 stop:1071 length:204 start_codon:yes stop_codon:yes gene_type:complete